MKISNRTRASAKYWATACRIGSKAKPPKARRKKEQKKKGNKRRITASDNRKKRARVIRRSLGGTPLEDLLCSPQKRTKFVCVIYCIKLFF